MISDFTFSLEGELAIQFQDEWFTGATLAIPGTPNMVKVVSADVLDDGTVKVRGVAVRSTFDTPGVRFQVRSRDGVESEHTRLDDALASRPDDVWLLTGYVLVSLSPERDVEIRPMSAGHVGDAVNVPLSMNPTVKVCDRVIHPTLGTTAVVHSTENNTIKALIEPWPNTFPVEATFEVRWGDKNIGRADTFVGCLRQFSNRLFSWDGREARCGDVVVTVNI